MLAQTVELLTSALNALTDSDASPDHKEVIGDLFVDACVVMMSGVI
jgi:hypothetical protein